MKLHRQLFHAGCCCVVTAGWCSGVRSAEFFGPIPYVQRTDTPTNFSLDTRAIEDFEDGSVDARIDILTATVIGPGSPTDSVDEDDGAIDGDGTNGRSIFSFSPIRIEFPLPTTEAGLVWTDGGPGTQVTFEAFDAQGASLGTHGPFLLGDDGNGGTTAEDRFFGVIEPAGIGAIEIRHTTGGYEVDHVQWLDAWIFRDGFE